MLLSDKVNGMVMKQFGVELPKAKYLMNSQGNVFMFTGVLPHLDYDKAGLYIGTVEKDGFRPSIEGAQLIGGRDAVELTDREAVLWMCGISLKKSTGRRDYVIIKRREDVLGAGKAKEDMIINYIQKNRRLPLKMYK